MKLIDACNPYKGGGNPLWEIDELNNIGKHRLILTVGRDVFCWAESVGSTSIERMVSIQIRQPTFLGSLRLHKSQR